MSVPISMLPPPACDPKSVARVGGPDPASAADPFGEALDLALIEAGIEAGRATVRPPEPLVASSSAAVAEPPVVTIELVLEGGWHPEPLEVPESVGPAGARADARDDVPRTLEGGLELAGRAVAVPPVPLTPGPTERTASLAPAPSRASEGLWVDRPAAAGSLEGEADRALFHPVPGQAGPERLPPEGAIAARPPSRSGEGGVDVETLLRTFAPVANQIEIAGFCFPATQPAEGADPESRVVLPDGGAPVPDQVEPDLTGGASGGEPGEPDPVEPAPSRLTVHRLDPRLDSRFVTTSDGRGPGRDGQGSSRRQDSGDRPVVSRSGDSRPAGLPVPPVPAAPRVETRTPVEVAAPRPALGVEPPARPPRLEQVTVQLKDEAGDHGTLRLSIQGTSLRATILPNDPELAVRLTEGLRDLHRALGDRGFSEARISVQAPAAGEGVPGVAPPPRDAVPTRADPPAAERQSGGERRDSSQHTAEHRRQGQRSPDRQPPERQQRGRWA